MPNQAQTLSLETNPRRGMLAPCGFVESALGAETKARPRAAIKSRFSNAESLAIRVGRIAQDSTLLDVTVRTDTKSVHND